jgi:hypothetical protein
MSLTPVRLRDLKRTVPWRTADLAFFAREQGMQTTSVRVVRDFRIEQRDVWAQLEQTWVSEVVRDFASSAPVPDSMSAFLSGAFYRLPNSHRSFYFSPFAADRSASADVIAFKGFEPPSPRFPELIAELRRPCYSPHNILEHFVFEERKVPGCLLMSEALGEAAVAAETQRAHLRRYGTLARLPVPLFVVQHSDEVVGRALEHLCANMSKPAARAMEATVTQGFGGYVYYYASAPIRVRDVDPLVSCLGVRARMLALTTQICDVERTIGRWVELFARLLHLGFVPGSLASLRTGICCQPQNACMDGGFVDLDSVVPVADFVDDTSLQAALQCSFDALVSSVRTLLVGSHDPTRDEAQKVRPDLFLVGEYVRAMLREALNSEARVGHELGPRIRAHFEPATSLAGLVDRLDPYFFSGSDGFGQATMAFAPFGLALAGASRGR